MKKWLGLLGLALLLGASCEDQEARRWISYPDNPSYEDATEYLSALSNKVCELEKRLYAEHPPTPTDTLPHVSEWCTTDQDGRDPPTFPPPPPE